MIMVTVIYVGLCFGLSPYGAPGIIGASMISLLLQIMLYIMFISRHVFDGRLRQLLRLFRTTLPHAKLAVSFFAAFLLSVGITELGRGRLKPLY